MPFNLLKKYPDLLELGFLDAAARERSLRAVFNRDVRDHPNLCCMRKQIRPLKREGEFPMETLFRHLTTREYKNEADHSPGSRSFEMSRSQRLHWVRTHLEKVWSPGFDIFSYEDRVGGRSAIRTYVFNEQYAYVVILEPQRSGQDYYLLTAYYIDEPGGLKQIKKKQAKRLPKIH
jgi:hypothetical protein